jgi:hypothetical protein
MVFASLQGLDVLTTLVGFVGGAGEANPVIAHLLPMLGPISGLIVGKLLTVAAIFALMHFKPTANTKQGWAFMNVAFACVIVWNLTILARIAIHLV